MKERLKKNEKYMAIVLRFLKETRLLPLWIEYVNQEIKNEHRFHNNHWSNVYTVDHVLGNSNFTTFVRDKLQEKDGVKYYEGMCMYHRFVIWIKTLGLLDNYLISSESMAFVRSVSDEDVNRNIIIDPVTRNTQIIFNSKRF